MTTIAYKDEIIASDTVFTSRDRKESINVPELPKIMTTEQFLIGVSGDSSIMPGIQSLLLHEKSIDKIERSVEDFKKDGRTVHIIIVNKKSKAIKCYDEDGWSNTIGYASIGSGRDVAMTALRSGKNAINAIRDAIESDEHSGGHIVFLNLSDPLKTAPKYAKNDD